MKSCMFMLVSLSLLLTFIYSGDVTCTGANVEVPVVGDAVIFMLVSSSLIFSLPIDGLTVCVTTDVPVGDAVIYMLVFSSLIFSLFVDGLTVCVTTDVPVVGDAVILVAFVSFLSYGGGKKNKLHIDFVFRDQEVISLRRQLDDAHKVTYSTFLS